MTFGMADSVLLLIAGNSQAQIAAGVARNGHDLAARLCLIGRAGTANGRPDVASFAAIAKSPNLTPERLVGAIVLTHPPMPGALLARNEIRGIIAYIVSLQPPNRASDSEFGDAERCRCVAPSTASSSAPRLRRTRQRSDDHEGPNHRRRDDRHDCGDRQRAHRTHDDA
jgi:hypothetical protein